METIKRIKMEVIKMGEKPGERWVVMTCPNCHSVLRARMGEMKYADDGPNRSWGYFTCMVCSCSITKWKDE